MNAVNKKRVASEYYFPAGFDMSCDAMTQAFNKKYQWVITSNLVQINNKGVGEIKKIIIF